MNQPAPSDPQPVHIAERLPGLPAVSTQAIHEAGHCTILAYVGVTDFISAIWDEDGRRTGKTLFNPQQLEALNDLERAMVGVAGAVASAVWRGEGMEGIDRWLSETDKRLTGGHGMECQLVRDAALAVLAYLGAGGLETVISTAVFLEEQGFIETLGWRMFEDQMRQSGVLH